MSIHTDSMQLLEEIYHCCKTNQSFSLSHDYLLDLLPNKYHDLEMLYCLLPFDFTFS